LSVTPRPFGPADEISERVACILAELDGRAFSFRVEAWGSRWEPLQSLRPEGPPLHPSDFRVSALHDLPNDRMRLSWRRDFLEPLTSTILYDEIIVGSGGYITGPDVALGSTPARPMPPDRVAAIRRQQQLLNPHLLLGDAFRRQAVTGEEVMLYRGLDNTNGAPHAVVEIRAFPRPILLFVNLEDNHVSSVATQENDFPRGDVAVVTTFTDWRRRDGVPMPHQVSLSLEGAVVHREERGLIEVNPGLNDATFALPGMCPFDPMLAEGGLVNCQWIHRGLALGAPISLHAGKVKTVEITPNVITVGGGMHHSMAVALPRGIVVVDSPQHEERSLLVIAAVRAKWPDRPITHLILTHHHHDHSGGIRTYAAIGAELIMAEGDRAFIADCLQRPHTIAPDTLSVKDVRPTITTVGSIPLSLGGGEIQVHRISSPHAAEDLVTYVAGPKAVFNADLFNPGMVPRGATPPPCWVEFSRDFRKQVEALELDIELLIGAHGSLEGAPYQELIAFTD
jgi:glyoxylase-like metal-dependent hydrolase (beta-lactamase superfamily II)